MMTFRARRLSVLTASLMMLAGCATQHEMHVQSVHRYNEANQQLTHQLAQHQPAATPVAPINSRFPYVNTVAVSHVGELPAIFDEQASFHAPAGPAWQFMERLQGLTGMAVHADDDVLDGSHGTTAAGGAGPSADATLTPPPSLGGGGYDAGARPSAQLAAIAFQGSMKQLLDLVAGQLDATWKYDSQTNSIHIFRFENRIFHINALPGDVGFDAGMESGSGQQFQGGQGQTVQAAESPGKTEFKGQVSIWKSLFANLKPMLSPQGSLQLNEALSSISVHDRWDRVDAIAKAVDQINQSLGMQVQVNVKIYRVQQNDQDNRGISWGVLYNTLGQAATNFGVSISTPQPTASGLASMILNSPTRNRSGSPSLFSGSQFFINALSTLGKVSAIQDATVETTNNEPVAFERVHSKAYVASTTPLVTTGTSSGSSVIGAGATIVPGTVVTGFDMTALPSVSPDGHRLLLQMKITVSTLDSLGSFTTGGNTVQQPNVSKADFPERTWLKSGQSLILAGFADTETNNTTNTVLDKSLWGLGGNRALANTKDEFVVVITPVVTKPQTTLE